MEITPIHELQHAKVGLPVDHKFITFPQHLVLFIVLIPGSILFTLPVDPICKSAGYTASAAL